MPLAVRPNPATIDLAAVVGYPTVTSVDVPRGAGLSLTIGTDGLPAVLDPASLAPYVPSPPVVLPPVAPQLSPPVVTPSAPVATVSAGDSATTAPEPLAPAEQYTDPCVVEPAGPALCSGTAAVVLPQAATAADVGDPAPLVLSAPLAATGGLADMCEEIERGVVADPQLAPAVRHTVAVLMNRPASVALTGMWDDGTPIEKLTMVSLAAHDALWQQQWEADGAQGQLLACLTFPLDVARGHANGGRARLTVDLIAISTDGQDTVTGAVTLEVPLDGDDVPFVEAYSVRDLGEQLLADGRRAPTLSVHYAIVDDARVPAGSALDAGSLTVLDVHGAVENADCAGWMANAQGQDRTLTSTYRVRQEQRTINGRQRSVTVVDGIVHLDPNVRSGWEGFLCTHLVATDRTGARATLALRGAAVRAPRTAVYQIGVRMATPLPAGWRAEVVWADRDGTVWCGPTTLGQGPTDNGSTTAPSADEAADVLSASCTTLARLHPGGTLVTMTAVGPSGAQGGEWTVAIPVNTEYCNTDDPDVATTDGCNTGWQQTWQLTLADGQYTAVTVVVLRDAPPGQVLTNPSHAWRIDPPQAFLT